MESIVFTDITEAQGTVLKKVFDFIANGKQVNRIDEDKLAELLGVIYETKFIHTKEESDEWLTKWKTNPDIEAPWDYGSWVDAILNSEIELDGLKIEINGLGILTFNQLAWPTGGISALEELIKIFGGKVISNDAI
ncbi:MAG: hypothetical protein OEY38_18980 [Gammaproteobacteria bacterium]|nr:hypothetical protein [Gammaproteobacteria bacterium]